MCAPVHKREENRDERNHRHHDTCAPRPLLLSFLSCPSFLPPCSETCLSPPETSLTSLYPKLWSPLSSRPGLTLSYPSSLTSSPFTPPSHSSSDPSMFPPQNLSTGSFLSPFRFYQSHLMRPLSLHSHILPVPLSCFSSF